MKRALILAAALTLTAATAASAQDHDDHGGGHPGGEAHQGGAPNGSHPGGPPVQHQGAAPASNPAGGFHGQPGQPGGGFHGQPGGDRNVQNSVGQRGGFGGEQHGGGFASDQRNAGFGGPRGGNGFTYRGHSFQSFRAAPFSYPSGYGYRRWGIGQRLPRLFLSPGYFINWGAYNLGPPAPGCEWVRYGPDALMVNQYTGQVVDVVYGVFY